MVGTARLHPPGGEGGRHDFSGKAGGLPFIPGGFQKRHIAGVVQLENRFPVRFVRGDRGVETALAQSVEDVFRARWPLERGDEFPAGQFRLWKMQAVLFAEEGFHA